MTSEVRSETGRSTDDNPYEAALFQFESAAECLGLENRLRSILRKPRRELYGQFPGRNGRRRGRHVPGLSSSAQRPSRSG